jgi:hypothetical protein
VPPNVNLLGTAGGAPTAVAATTVTSKYLPKSCRP